MSWREFWDECGWRDRLLLVMTVLPPVCGAVVLVWFVLSAARVL